MHEGNELATSNCNERHNEPRINIVQHRDICWCNDSRGSMFSATTVAYYGTLLPIIPDGSKGSVIHGSKHLKTEHFLGCRQWGSTEFRPQLPVLPCLDGVNVLCDVPTRHCQELHNSLWASVSGAPACPNICRGGLR
jgi:hypothetical protein